MLRRARSHRRLTYGSPVRHPSRLHLLLLTVLIASGSAPLHSQCSIVYSAEIVPAPNYAVVFRVFSGSVGAAGPCVTTTSNNAFICNTTDLGNGFYGCTNTMGCQALIAAATGVTTNPQSHSCAFSCGGCGQQIIDNSDGLPIELMDFSVEGDDLGDVGRAGSGARGPRAEDEDRSD